MLLIPRKGLRKSSKEEAAMHSVTTAQTLIQNVFPASKYGSVKQAVNEAYNRLRRHYVRKYPDLEQLTIRRVETLWQGTARRVEWHEVAALQDEKDRLQANENAAQLARTAALLRQIDPEFYGETASVLERAAASGGALDRPMAED